MSDLNDMQYLVVKGKSKLDKEIEETRGLVNKTIDSAALYRNEETGEFDEVQGN